MKSPKTLAQILGETRNPPPAPAGKLPPPALAGRKGDYGPARAKKIQNKDRPSAYEMIMKRKGVPTPPPAKA